MNGGVEMVLTNPELLSKTDYVAVRPDSARCVDDRPDKNGENFGPQFPGASEHLMDLMLLAVNKSGESVGEDKLFEMVNRVYESDVAKKHNLVPGVHIDDEHGHLGEEECAGRVDGCGYDKVRRQVLEQMGIRIDYETGARIGKARELGWEVQLLTSHHANNATAAVNEQTDMTLNTKKLWSGNRTPSFNHDIWAVTVLIPEMESKLRSNGYAKGANLLNVYGEKWSREIYGHTLDILTGGRLNRNTLIQIK